MLTRLNEKKIDAAMMVSSGGKHMTEEKKITFEDALDKLEKASNSLNSDDTTLEEALKNYEEGIKYYNECSKILNDAKQTIEVFQKKMEE